MIQGLAINTIIGTIIIAVSQAAWGHIGSPNVFYEGTAGPYPVRVIIRPPGAVPGLAEISVRVEASDVRGVAVLPVYWNAGRKGAPPPDRARPVPGDSSLYSAELWIMKVGSYSVFVDVEGDRGTGTAIVPLNSVAVTRLDLPSWFGGMLLGLGTFLFLLALSIVWAASRESALEPGEEPGRSRRLVALGVCAVAATLFSLALLGGKKWWDGVDEDYRQKRLFRPLEVEAAVRLEGPQRILRLTLANMDWRGQPLSPLVPDHGKLMHLFLLREPVLDALLHLHPVRVDETTFDVALPPVPAGSYRAYADITHETGFSETLTASLDVMDSGDPREASGALLPSDPDDSSWVGEPASGVREGETKRSLSSALGGGFTMKWEVDEPLIENRGASLRFSVLDPQGKPALLETYMGMLAHAAVSRTDGAVFAHLHPVGSISMASVEVFERRERDAGEALISPGQTGGPTTLPVVMDHSKHAMHSSAPSSGGQVISFPYEFPKPGLYRIWVQVKIQGKILTGVFDAEVLQSS